MNKKSPIVFCILLIFIFSMFFFPGCKDEKDNNPVSPGGGGGVNYYIEGNIVGGIGLVKKNGYVYGQHTAGGKANTTLVASDSAANAIAGINTWTISYPTNVTGQYVCDNVTAALKFRVDSTNDYYLAISPLSSCTLVITSYGAVGQTIEGIFHGTITHYTNGMNVEGNYNVTGSSFIVSRIADQ